jgi:HD superfamily phosphohydrolase
MKRHFACAVHGAVVANSLECAVIDHPIFQRLRKVKQLGNTHNVFPGATHSRFSHSLGVMHMAGLLFDGAFGSLPNSQARERVRQHLRLAALLHDVGHGPYSHHFENLLVVHNVTKSSTSYEALVYKNWNAPELKIPESFVRPDRSVNYTNDHLHHEHFTYGLVCHLSHVLPGVDSQAICALLDGRIYPSQSLWNDLAQLTQELGGPPEAAESMLACLKSFLSSEIDADRMDYLQRDALYAGVKIGLDVRHLLHSIAIVFDPQLQRCVVDVRPNAVAIIEQILIARKMMFDQVYQHRVTLQFDDLLKFALMYWMKLHKKEAPNSLETFLKLTDELVDEELKKLVADTNTMNESEERLALKMFLTRTVPVLIEDVLVNEANELEPTLQRLRKEHPNARYQVVHQKDFFKQDRLTEDSSKDTLFVVSRMVTQTSQSSSRRPLRLDSEVLQSSAWQRSSFRILVTHSLAKSAQMRHLEKKLIYI